MARDLRLTCGLYRLDNCVIGDIRTVMPRTATSEQNGGHAVPDRACPLYRADDATDLMTDLRHGAHRARPAQHAGEGCTRQCRWSHQRMHPMYRVNIDRRRHLRTLTCMPRRIAGAHASCVMSRLGAPYRRIEANNGNHHQAPKKITFPMNYTVYGATDRLSGIRGFEP